MPASFAWKGCGSLFPPSNVFRMGGAGRTGKNMVRTRAEPINLISPSFAHFPSRRKGMSVSSWRTKYAVRIVRTHYICWAVRNTSSLPDDLYGVPGHFNPVDWNLSSCRPKYQTHWGSTQDAGKAEVTVQPLAGCKRKNGVSL
jgi:hypothetical protein